MRFSVAYSVGLCVSTVTVCGSQLVHLDNRIGAGPNGVTENVYM